MRILTSEQVRQCDAFTISQGTKSIELMEYASTKCFVFCLEVIPPLSKVIVFAGPGNNGGDGLVIARLLLKEGYDCKVIYCRGKSQSNDNLINLEAFEKINGEVIDFFDGLSMDADFVIDAILGSGLNKSLEGNYLHVAELINRLPAIVIAIDSPTGFFTDSPMPPEAKAVYANYTLCFHAPKLLFFFSESYQYVGDWFILDIGLKNPDDKDYHNGSLPYYLTEVNNVSSFIKPRNTFSHKGNFGHCFIIGGSNGKYGANILASKAAIHAGAGLVTSVIPKAGISAVNASIPEVMTIDMGEEGFLSGTLNVESASAIGFGPGCGKHDETAKLLKALIQQGKKQFVIDADGLNILSENKTWLSFLSTGTILTPHPGELDRLCGDSNSGFERLEKAKELAIKHSIIVVLKGAYTAVCLPTGEVCFNSTGNPGMAKGGSGDTLTGIITALLAQGLPQINAAILGVYIHGLAGDLAADEHGEISMKTSDIIDCLGKAFNLVSPN